MKNILITTPSFQGKGGVSQYYRTILPFLKDSLRYNISHIEVGNIHRSHKYLYPLYDQLRIYKHLSKKNVDFFKVNPSLDQKSIIRDGMFTLWAKKHRIPVIVFFHGWQLPCEEMFEGRYQYFVKKIILNADCFIVLSSAFKEKLKEWGVKVPVFTETTIVDDSLVSNFSIQSKIKLLGKTQQTKILFLARVEKEKGIFETIDAFNILKNRGHSITLSIAGAGSAMQKVRNYLSALNLSPELCKFLGYVKGEQKIETFSSHDIYCLPSYGEGMPTSVLEAMAFGMPVITCPTGGLKDFFENDKMGYFSYTKKDEEIADFIEIIIKNKKKMIDMAKYNYEYAKEYFLASKAAKRIKNIYETIFLAK